MMFYCTICSSKVMAFVAQTFLKLCICKIIIVNIIISIIMFTTAPTIFAASAYGDARRREARSGEEGGWGMH